MKLERVLVTGGCGFIGSTFIDLMASKRPDVKVVNLDRMTYAANPLYAQEPFFEGSITDRALVARAMEGVDAVVNFAAESHVDRSLGGAEGFVEANLRGVVVLLDEARRRGVRFLQVSTDEVYGSCDDQVPFLETAPFRPGNPYSVTKAAADFMVQAYFRSWKIDAVITRGVNTYGPRQFPEKFVPVMVAKCLAGEPLPIYGDGMQRRQWIHARDHALGILTVLERGRAGEAYNLVGIGGGPNIEVARAICRFLDRPERLEHVADRPGHDRVYAIDGMKAFQELGWRAEIPFADGLKETVKWYAEHPEWTAKLEEARTQWGKP